MKRVQLISVWAVSLALVAASCARPAPRPIRPLPDEAFRVEWIANTAPKIMKAGASSNVSVTIKNLSGVAWPDPRTSGSEPPAAGAVRLGYRWLSASSPSVVSEGPSRTDLDDALQPGHSVTLSLMVTAPSAPGEYRLQVDLVQELVTWFETKGAAPLLIPVRVQ
jgi:hypothetical protein